MHKRLLYLIFFLSVNLFSSIDNYFDNSSSNSHSNYGSIGIIQLPSARLNEAGTIGFSLSNFDPYSRLSFLAYPFDWLEASYQYTDIQGILYSDNFAFSRNQTYKDKGFDLKFRLKKETKYLPQIAVGFRDIAGTGLFASDYIAFSKRFKYFDFTAGILWGAFYDDFKNPLIYLDKSFQQREDFGTSQTYGGEITADSFFKGRHVGIYSGVEFFLPQFRNSYLKIEYDPTKYQIEAFGNAKKDSFFNFGYTYKFNDNWKFTLGYIRGNTIQYGVSFTPNLGKKDGLVKKQNNRKKLQRSQAIKNVNSREDRYYYLSLLKYLGEEGFYLRSADISDEIVSVSYAQTKYLSYPKSYGRLTAILDDISPNSIKEFQLIPQNAGFELAEIKIPRTQYIKNSKNLDFNTLDQYIQKNPSYKIASKHKLRPSPSFPASFSQIQPDFQSHIGGPDRFLAGSLVLNIKNELLLRRNFNIQTLLRYKLVDTFDVLKQPSDSILPHVRTDIIEYLKQSKDLNIFRMQSNYFFRPSKSIYGKLSLGIYEEMFGGYGFEFLYKPYEKNYAIGVEAYDVRQRGFEQRFDFRDYETITGHTTFYYNFERSNVLLRLVGGRYLAKDSGFTFDLSKRFKSGMKVGVYFTRTDISKEEFGEGSFDKGFYVSVPLQLFSSSNSRELGGFGLSPLTRDGGVKMNVGLDLWGVTEEANMGTFIRDKDDIY